jgi:hypothetical protein
MILRNKQLIGINCSPYPLPSNGSSLRDLKRNHSDYQASDESGIVIFRHYL